MKEKILLNERYGVVEIDKTGVITGHNKNALFLLSNICRRTDAEDMKGSGISEICGTGEVIAFDPAIPEKSISSILSSIKGILLVDTVFYKETESVIARFVRDNEVFASFLNMLKFSLSLYLELDNELNIIFSTDSFCKTAGAEKSGLYGENISIYLDRQSLVKISSAADLFRNNVLIFIKLDGVQFMFKKIESVFDLELSAVKDKSGEFSGIYCQLLDKSFEKKCSKMTSTMRRMSAIANFAGGIAHDYNNALTAVLGNISLAKMDAEKNSELDELLRDAESAGLKIKTLTERLGMFARGMKPAKDKTDIRKLIEGIIPETFSGYKGIYSIKIQDNMICPEIDSDLMSEALRHIVENAVDAVDETKGEIFIEAEEVEINKESVFRETTLVSGKYIVVSVRDNGSGIDLSAPRDIFDPYVTTKTGREGLGLALAYTIIKRHRGFISAGAAENSGAEFKIYIPLF